MKTGNSDKSLILSAIEKVNMRVIHATLYQSCESKSTGLFFKDIPNEV